jgi:hypothetical protein
MKSTTHDLHRERFLLATLSIAVVGKKRGASVFYDLDPKHFRTVEVDTAAATVAPDVVNRNLTSSDSDSISSILVDECVLIYELTRMRVSTMATTWCFPPSFSSPFPGPSLSPLPNTLPLQRDDQHYDQAISGKRRGSRRVRHRGAEGGS